MIDGVYDTNIGPASLDYTYSLAAGNSSVDETRELGGRVPGGGFVDLSHARGFEPPVYDPLDYVPSHSEVLGTEQILHGFKLKNTFLSTTYGGRARGIFPMVAFNGPNAVEPGRLGELTWDLPAWAAVDGALVFDDELNDAVVRQGQETYEFGAFVTAIDEWKLVTVPLPSRIPYSFGSLYTLVGDPIAKCSLIGAGAVYSVEPIEIDV